MKQQILVIHGGDAYSTYEKYIENLQLKELTLEKLRSVGWKGNLANDLGKNFDVLTPKMPNPLNARYREWKIWLEKMIPLLDENIILIGHSLGGILLIKYLSENKYPKNIIATFLVAAPYYTSQHPLVDFTITSPFTDFIQQAGKIIIYHSADDATVPFADAMHYHEQLPNSNLIKFADRGHFNTEHFPEIIKDLNHYLSLNFQKAQ